MHPSDGAWRPTKSENCETNPSFWGVLVHSKPLARKWFPRKTGMMRATFWRYFDRERTQDDGGRDKAEFTTKSR